MTTTGILPSERRTLRGRWATLRLDAMLVLVTMIWGSTFLVVQHAVRLSGPFSFLTLRFGIGALTLALLFSRRLRRLTRSELLAGIWIGIFLFATYALQTTGLLFTTSSKAAFITSLYVPLVPFFSWLLLRERVSRLALVGVVLSVVGLVLLSLTDRVDLSFGLGEALVLGCAVAAALHIVAISRFAPHADALNLACVQIAVVAVLSLVAMPLAGEPFVWPTPPVWIAALAMGVVATAFAVGAMNAAQQLVSGTRATLIYALEPAWAGVLGALAGERISALGWVGCGLILLGMLAGGLGARR